jgi:hypothetical protein
MSTTENYPTRQEVLDRWDDLPSVRVRFAVDESGWAKVVDEAKGWLVLANTPLTDGLGLHDLVTVGPDNVVKEVLRPAYDYKTTIQYPWPSEEEGKKHWLRLCTVAKGMGIMVEGYMAGRAGISCDSEAQAEALLTRLREEDAPTQEVDA